MAKRKSARTDWTQSQEPRKRASGTPERPNADQDFVGHRLKIVYRHINEVKPDPRNPRIHSPRQIRKLAKIIAGLGFNVPVLIGRNGELLAGHARYAACKILGLKEIATIELDHLDEHQARSFALADNRLSDLSEWNQQLVAQHLWELSQVLDFDVELSGFDIGEIDFKIEELNSSDEGEPDALDNFSEVSPKAYSVARAGDLFVLNDHRILVANALEESSFVTLMNGKRASMILSDPPYNLRIENFVSGLGKIQHTNFAMASGEMSEAEFIVFLRQICSLFARHSYNGSLHYLFIDWRHVGELLTAAKAVYSELKNIAVWVKSTPGMGSLYRSQHELVAIFKSGHGPHRNNIQLGQFGQNRSNVWSYASINSFGGKGEEGNLLALHPTVKPVGLLSDAIADCTTRHDIVLDGFLGSGSTVLAAERTGRCCYGMEIDPLYVDTAIRRWQNYTRDHARHALTGRLFDEIEAEREGHHGDR
jgi:DNA modification methylase